MDVFIFDCMDVSPNKVSYNFLRWVLHKKFPNIVPNIQKTRFGKLTVTNIPNFHFNISHSGSLIAIATASCPVGIDLQNIKTINYSIVTRFFSQDEINSFSLIPQNNKTSYFFDLWTLKESFVKCTGLGFSHMPFKNFSVQLEDTIRVKVYDRFMDEYKFYQLNDVKIGYKFALCLQGNTSKINIHFVENIPYYFLLSKNK